MKSASKVVIAVVVCLAGGAVFFGGADSQSVSSDYDAVLNEVRTMGQEAQRMRSPEQILGVIAKMSDKLNDFREAHPGTPEAADATFQLGTLKVSEASLTQNPEVYGAAVGYLSEYLVKAGPDAPRENIATAHYYLAEAYKNTGKIDDARHEYNVVINEYGDVNSRMTQYARNGLQTLDAEAKLAIGGEALAFEVKSLSGETLSPDKYRGKVLLIDFWATWCKPCIAEMPNVIRAYDKYNDKGFEIVGISLDRSRSDLDRYLQKSGMDWPQYFDGKFWNNDIAQLYGVKSIPATYLIDRKGKIRYKSLRGPALERAIERLLSEDA